MRKMLTAIILTMSITLLSTSPMAIEKAKTRYTSLHFYVEASGRTILFREKIAREILKRIQRESAHGNVKVSIFYVKDDIGKPIISSLPASIAEGLSLDTILSSYPVTQKELSEALSRLGNLGGANDLNTYKVLASALAKEADRAQYGRLDTTPKVFAMYAFRCGTADKVAFGREVKQVGQYFTMTNERIEKSANILLCPITNTPLGPTEKDIGQLFHIQRDKSPTKPRVKAPIEVRTHTTNKGNTHPPKVETKKDAPKITNTQSPTAGEPNSPDNNDPVYQKTTALPLSDNEIELRVIIRDMDTGEITDEVYWLDSRTVVKSGRVLARLMLPAPWKYIIGADLYLTKKAFLEKTIWRHATFSKDSKDHEFDITTISNTYYLHVSLIEHAEGLADPNNGYNYSITIQDNATIAQKNANIIF